MKPLRVHYIQPPADVAAMNGLRAGLPAGVELTDVPDIPLATDFHILIAGRPTREWLRASPNLTTLIVPFAGLPSETRDLIAAEFPHLRVHNIHHNAAATAEMAVALLLAAAKTIVPIDRQFRTGDWSARFQPQLGIELAGKTALILGMGAIGQRVAKSLAGLDMKIIGVRRRGADADEAPGNWDIFGPSALPDLWPRANVVMVCLPLTPHTTGLIGAAELAALPANAMLVNVGRAAIVNEAALFAALNSRQLAGAGLDVWYRYPAAETGKSDSPRTAMSPSQFPFHELENVVMSPHRAGWTRDTELNRVREILNLLALAAAGQPLPRPLTMSDGY